MEIIPLKTSLGTKCNYKIGDGRCKIYLNGGTVCCFERNNQICVEIMCDGRRVLERKLSIPLFRTYGTQISNFIIMVSCNDLLLQQDTSIYARVLRVLKENIKDVQNILKKYIKTI